jgi:hypothetical protein
MENAVEPRGAADELQALIDPREALRHSQRTDPTFKEISMGFRKGPEAFRH